MIWRFWYFNTIQKVVISNYSNWCHDSLWKSSNFLSIEKHQIDEIKQMLEITFQTSLSLEHYMNKWQAGCLQNLLISHQLKTKYFYKQLLVPINIPSWYGTFKTVLPKSVGLSVWSFFMSLFMIHHRSSELDFRCKLVLIQCNNRSGAHSLK